MVIEAMGVMLDLSFISLHPVLLVPTPITRFWCTDVEDAIPSRADAVSIHVNVGADDEAEMLHDLGRVARTCDFMGHASYRHDVSSRTQGSLRAHVEYVKLAARIGSELGADIVKTNYTGSLKPFQEVVQGCSVPIIIAGGPQDGTQRGIYCRWYMMP